MFPFTSLKEKKKERKRESWVTTGMDLAWVGSLQQGYRSISDVFNISTESYILCKRLKANSKLDNRVVSNR